MDGIWTLTWFEGYDIYDLLVGQNPWQETARAFEDMEAGSETAMRDYKRVDISMTCGVGEAVGQIGCVAENGLKMVENGRTDL